MLRTICESHTDLSAEDILQLLRVREQLPLIAELTDSDVFIDCMMTNGNAVVVDHARPSIMGSAYKNEVVGVPVLPEREPAVFRSMELQTSVRDLKAITQEDKVVRQDVTPIKNRDGRCIAVLIRETDISGDLRYEKKYQTLARTYEQQDYSLRADGRQVSNSLIFREANHRVKNNLQLVASTLSLHARRCGDENARSILEENVNRVLSIAAIHDILSNSREEMLDVDCCILLEQLCKNLQDLASDALEVRLLIPEEPIRLRSDLASAVALAVNELVTNAIKHGFPQNGAGVIRVDFCTGALYHTITVSDNGVGFDALSVGGHTHLGLRIVETLVSNQLHGHLRIHSSPEGTRISFDFKTE